MEMRPRPVADINITPLIDVMLVLLIIFMTVVPVARRGLSTALPRPAVEGERPPLPAPVVVVEPTAFILNGDPTLTLPELAAGLRDVLLTRADKTVFIRSLDAVSYARVVEVVDAARGAGADRIGLIPPARD